MTMKITDLPVDVISLVFSSVAKSSDGAADIARSMSACKSFLEAAKDNTVRKAVCFQNVDVMKKYHLLQKTTGLLYSFVIAGNVSAQILLAKVILVSSHKLVQGSIERCYPCFQEDQEAASFLASFTPGQGHRTFLFHWELIKIFLSNCSKEDFYNMRVYIWGHIVYFAGWCNNCIGIYFGRFNHLVFLFAHWDVITAGRPMGCICCRTFKGNGTW